MTSIGDLRTQYGSDWTIRDQPSISATRRHQLDNDPDHLRAEQLEMTVWAEDLPELADKLAAQTRLTNEDTP
jgi:hypothetical protein